MLTVIDALSEQYDAPCQKPVTKILDNLSESLAEQSHVSIFTISGRVEQVGGRRGNCS